MHNLQIKQDPIDRLNIPIKLVNGTIEKLDLIIPWNNLGSQPIKCDIDGLFVLLRRRANEDVCRLMMHGDSPETRSHSFCPVCLRDCVRVWLCLESTMKQPCKSACNVKNSKASSAPHFLGLIKTILQRSRKKAPSWTTS
jgi:hypothetical protein